MPFKSKHKYALLPVVAPAVFMVMVPALLSLLIEPMVTVPLTCPLRSLLQKLPVEPAVTAAALVTLKPEGNVSTIWPAAGMAVEAKNSTWYCEVAPADLDIGNTRVGFMPCWPGSILPPPGPIWPPVLEEF